MGCHILNYEKLFNAMKSVCLTLNYSQQEAGYRGG